MRGQLRNALPSSASISQLEHSVVSAHNVPIDLECFARQLQARIVYDATTGPQAKADTTASRALPPPPADRSAISRFISPPASVSIDGGLLDRSTVEPPLAALHHARVVLQTTVDRG